MCTLHGHDGVPVTGRGTGHPPGRQAAFYQKPTKLLQQAFSYRFFAESPLALYTYTLLPHRLHVSEQNHVRSYQHGGEKCNPRPMSPVLV